MKDEGSWNGSLYNSINLVCSLNLNILLKEVEINKTIKMFWKTKDKNTIANPLSFIPICL